MNSLGVGFCPECSDWLSPDGWQEDERYFCPTCLEFVKIDVTWKTERAIASGYLNLD